MPRFRYLYACALSTLFILLALGSGAQERYALIIASGQYQKGLSIDATPLKGTLNDAHLMLSLMQWKYGLKPQNIRVLGAPPNLLGTGFESQISHADREAILDGLRWMAQKVKGGALGVVYYSGHGASLTVSNQIRPSKAVQCWIPYDGNCVFDFEIGKILEPVQDRPLTLIVDSCYSGGMARGGSTKPKYVHLSQSLLLAQMEQRLKSMHGKLPPQRISANAAQTLLAACDEDDSSVELTLSHVPGVPGVMSIGAFTFALYQTLYCRSGNIKLGSLQQALTRKLSGWHLSQTPYVEGGNPDRVAIASVVGSTPALSIHQGELQAGFLAGVQPNDVLITVADRNAPPAIHAEQLQVESVGWFSSRIRSLLPTRAKLPEIVVPQGISLPNRDLLKGYTFAIQKRGVGDKHPNPFTESFSEEAPQLIIHVQAPTTNGKWSITTETAAGESGVLATASSEADAQKQAQALAQSLQWQHLFSGWENLQHPLGLTLTTTRGAAPTYYLDEKVQITLQAERPGYVLLLAFEPNGSMSILYPNAEEKTLQIGKQPKSLPPMTPEDPVGDSVLTAFMTTKPFVLPEGLLQRKEGDDSYSVPLQNVAAFLDWLNGSLRATAVDAPQLTRNLSVKSSVAAIDKVDATTLTVHVMAKKEK